MGKSALTTVLASAGLIWSAVSVLDPTRPWGRILGTILVFLALAFRRGSGRFRFAAVLSIAWAIAGGVPIEFRGDSAAYFAYLRSAVFDRDLDLRNDMTELRGEDRPLPERQRSVFSAGPAFVWSPFYLAAHAYTYLDRASGRGLYAPDGFSVPYRRATLLATVAIVTLGFWLLGGAIARTQGHPVAFLAVSGSVLASPLLYYTFYVPAMSHGVASGLGAAFLRAWDETRRQPTFEKWALLGGTLGLLAACRWQAAVYGILAALLLGEALAGKRFRLGWALGASSAAILAFAPQMIAWQVHFGNPLAFPRGPGAMDPTSPHLLDTLISADHGLFNWTPLMLLGFLGLVAGVGRHPLLHGGGLLVFGLVAWINGSVPSFDWAAGDAFGARRYSEVVPLMTFGLAFLIDCARPVLTRWPLAAPAAAVALLALWNFGFITHFRARKYVDSAPLERLASDQARLFQERSEDALGVLAGAEGRALAYKVFSGEYLYAGLHPSGTILLRSAEENLLLRGWGAGSRRTARKSYRRALFPESCVAIPLDALFPLRVSVTARTPEGLTGQEVSLAVNDRVVGSAGLGRDWRDVPFLVPEESLVRGRNAFCLRFTKAVPEPDGSAVAALVEKLQLP